MKTQYSCHKDSHKISKEKPKIRIIHIVAPEIIKTDAENFRSLVQKLTGKPLGKSSSKKGKNVSSLQKKKSQPTSLQKAAADHNPNSFLSFMGEGLMHGGMNINEFPLLHFRPNSQINTFGHISFC